MADVQNVQNVRLQGLQGIRPKPPANPNPNAVAMSNAAAWNAPGGGYDQFRKKDPDREKALPIGTMLPIAPLAKEKK